MTKSLTTEPASEKRPAHVPAHGKGVLRPFVPGQTGNPGGKGGAYFDMVRLARASSPQAMRKIIQMMDDPDSRVALMAADKVLERAWGKPKEHQPEAEAAADTADRAEARAKFMVLIERMEAVAGRNDPKRDR